MMRGATLFSGGGGVEARLKDCIEFVHAVEYDPAIAAVYRANHGDHMQVADVCEVDYSLWGKLDYLHASPVCKNASQAKTGGEESDTDIQTAQAVVRCLEATQPRVFTLENVGGYQRFEAYRRICQALDRGGYMWHAEVLNAADYGVPQTRRRLILRAVRDALLPGWPAPLPWVGWYAAIEDLIPWLPASQFAPWQLARLPELFETTLIEGTGQSEEFGLPTRRADEPVFVIRAAVNKGLPRAFLVASNSGPNSFGDNTRHAEEPAFTTVPNANGRMRAFVVGGGNTNKNIIDSTYRDASEPMYTIASGNGYIQARAFLVAPAGEHGDLLSAADEPAHTVTAAHLASKHRAWLSQGRVVKMTPRALARFQSLPDSFLLPDKASLACTVIGNAVPSLLMREVVKPLL